MPKPLSHFRIVDLSCVLAGPFAGYMLGQMGADVIRFERIDQPEMIRNNSLDPLLAPLGLGEGFVMQGSGKRAIGGDIRDPDVKAAIHALSQSLRVEARDSGVRITEILPTSVSTPFFRLHCVTSATTPPMLVS